MKKALVALALAAIANVASAAIANTPHDLAVSGSLGTCQYCHAPHFSNVSVAAAPLWNRTLNSTGFTLYSTTNVAAPAELHANTLTCLSCHDGRQNIGTVYGGAAGTGPVDIAVIGGGLIGVDLQDDHPVSIPYTGGDLQGTPLNGIMLYNYGAGDQVECASCHEPHDNSLGAFLRDTKARLCGDCHTK